MEELLKAFDVMGEVYPHIKNLNSRVALGALIGTLVDQWTADHDLDQAVGREIIQNVLEVMPEVHEAEGPMPKTVVT